MIVSLQFFTPSNHSLDQLKVVFFFFQLWYTFKFQQESGFIISGFGLFFSA